MTVIRASTRLLASATPTHGLAAYQTSHLIRVGGVHGARRWQSNKSRVQPLKGVTVVTIEQAIAAPFCSRQLADLGARVIKVERPGEGDFARRYDSRVDGLSSHFVWTNRSKESLALDLKAPKDLAILKELIVKKADVFVQNLAPGASGRMGLSYEDLRKAKPDIIVADISGYGSDGPYRDKKAYDLLIQSEAGVLAVTGSPGQPAKVGPSIADISAGMYAFSSILTALYHRQATGEGSHIDVSMLESMIEWMSFPMYYAYKGQPQPALAGASHAAIYPYGQFAVAEGGSVMLGIQNEREWKSFCELAISRPELASDPRFSANVKRSANRDALKHIIEDAWRTLTAEQVVQKLEAANIANAKVNQMADLWSHPQLKARKRWTKVDSPRGKLPALLPPGLAKGFEARMDKIPAVGEHNESILAELEKSG